VPPAPLSTGSRPTRVRTRRAAVRALVAGLVLGASVACTTTGADEPTRSAGQEGYVGVQRNLTRIAPADREPLTPVAGTSLDGEPLSTGDHRGQVVVVNVWGSWCAPCRSEAPALQAASEKTRGRAQFIGITTRDNDPAQARAFVRAFGITYPSIYDPKGSALLAFAGTLPPSAIPSTLILDTEGRVAVRVLGEISELTLVAMVDDVAAGK
jgi:thiol-disulfide isomerase/thioredoxin